MKKLIVLILFLGANLLIIGRGFVIMDISLSDNISKQVSK